jgi:hypothetical protein
MKVNRQERRKIEAKIRKTKMTLNQIDLNCDIQVEGKREQIVMVYANPKGRQIIEDLWPDVEWATDEIFSSVHPSDWLFTHIRVTKLPPCFEAQVPLTFASPDCLGFCVAAAIQRRAEPKRVVHWSGYGADTQIGMFDDKPDYGDALFAEWVPSGTMIGAPESMN